ncbi:hypothetical protein B0A48_10618 [Cryoendolithus antarcticus]|uniref:Uncharacterized protein n=1 Tax=Cryoendolithus antarcticus TaxID=1507870 RepID=A0A1V8SXU0_9PEZI|nr:hypothetical protein B0A48_10618 [Cryoendolithus antarcticus]
MASTEDTVLWFLAMLAISFRIFSVLLQNFEIRDEDYGTAPKDPKETAPGSMLSTLSALEDRIYLSIHSITKVLGIAHLRGTLARLRHLNKYLNKLDRMPKRAMRSRRSAFKLLPTWQRALVAVIEHLDSCSEFLVSGLRITCHHPPKPETYHYNCTICLAPRALLLFEQLALAPLLAQPVGPPPKFSVLAILAAVLTGAFLAITAEDAGHTYERTREENVAPASTHGDGGSEEKAAGGYEVDMDLQKQETQMMSYIGAEDHVPLRTDGRAVKALA